MNYLDFIENKSQLGGMSGFSPVWMPSFLFDFQQHLDDWSIRKGRAAIYADCGLGKSPMQLVWAENVVRHTNKPVLILTPLAVASQTAREADKFGIECKQSRDGKIHPNITVTNYEKLHLFSPNDFAGCVCDESSILKNFDGATKAAITDFMKKMEFRLLCTATAAPNDYIELGTSSEALGELGYMDMLAMFFKSDDGSLHPHLRPPGGHGPMKQAKWRFKAHAERHFWRWLCSWSRAVRKPSDLGFDDGKFQLPQLIINSTIVNASRPANGKLFVMPAQGLAEQREERRHTIQERCEMVAEKVKDKRCSVVWCHLNDEGDLLEKLIPNCVQVSGKDSDDEKEEKFLAFSDGKIQRMIIKPSIGAFGLNWQHCNHMTLFPSHSFEKYYQAIRRCWRFGQTEDVTADIITTEGEAEVMTNLQRKADAADKMFSEIVGEMNSELRIKRNSAEFNQKEIVPSWLQSIKKSPKSTPSIMETASK